MSDSQTDEILTVSGLEKTYKTSSETLTILKNLDMHVVRGTKCVIVGRSGSGKSTLLNIIGGLDAPTRGAVVVDGRKISALSEGELTEYRQHFLGLVFQFHYLLKDFTALENVFFPAYMAGVPKKEALEKARSLLADVGLADRADHLPSQLSGGERQRVAVARCLVNNPELILADEPTGNLDPKSAEDVLNLLGELNREEGVSVIIVTHDPAISAKCHREILVGQQHAVVQREVRCPS